MKISIIIPTLNRSNYLKLALKSIVRQTMNPEEFEILVIDNGSTDNTRYVVEDTIKKYLNYNICYIYEPEPGLLSGRHRGALEAKGEILVFIDDDIEADKEWLFAIKEVFDKYPDVQMVGGRNLPKFEIEPPNWILRMWDKGEPHKILPELSLLDLGDEMREIDPIYVWGLNFSIRKSALFDLGGFHPDIMPKHLQHFQGDGETGLSIKAKEKGYKAIYQPKALVYHNIPSSRMIYDYFESRYFFQGVCDSYTDIRMRYGRYRHKKTLKKEIKRLLRPIKWKIKIDILKFFMKQEDKLMLRFLQAWLNGYNFHQNAVKKNSKLLEWVLKENYWDYKIPKLILKL